MKAHPIYMAGSLAFTMLNGFPQVATLMEAAWTLNESETCRFRMKDPKEWLPNEEQKDEPRASASKSSLPPPPASPDEDSSSREAMLDLFPIDVISRALRPQSIPSSSSRKRNSSALDDRPAKEEAWNLKDVVFIDDNNKASPAQQIGIVIKVEGPHCAVVFPDPDGAIPEDPNERLQRFRILRKEDLIAYKPGKTPKQPECVQKEPKRLKLAMRPGMVMDVMVDDKGIISSIK